MPVIEHYTPNRVRNSAPNNCQMWQSPRWRHSFGSGQQSLTLALEHAQLLNEHPRWRIR